LSKIAISGRTNVTMKVVLSEKGSIVCATSADSPSSSEMLILQGTPVVGQSMTSPYSSSYPNSMAVEYTLTGLSPSTLYNVYCATLSPTLVPLSRVQVLRSKTVIETICCQMVQVKLNQVVFDDVSDVPFALTLDIGQSLAKTIDLKIEMSVIKLAENGIGSNFTSANIFSPSLIKFSSPVARSSVDLTYVHDAMKDSSLLGKYQLNVTMSGASRFFYEISFPSGSTFVVKGFEAPLPGPLMKNASFSSDGSKILLEFTSSTDRGGSLKYDTNCFSLFHISPLTSSLLGSRCVWLDDKSLQITLVSGLSVGDSIILREGVVKAQCTSRVDNCESWSHSIPHNITVSPPVSPLVPVVVVSIPRELGACDNLMLDLTSSTGSGGRPWKSLALTISVSSGSSGTSTTPDTTSLQHFLANLTSTSPMESLFSSPIVVPHRFFVNGNLYTLEAKLCNFLHSCGKRFNTFSVSSSSAVPVSYLRSRNSISLSRRDPLLITGGGYVSLCGEGDGSKSTSNLEYKWSLYLDKVLQTSSNLQSTSVNPMQFKLPSYRLSPGRLYVVKLEVKHLISLKFSSVSVEVNVKTGDLVCFFSSVSLSTSSSTSSLVPLSGSSLALRVDESLLLDWSQSYDEDSGGLNPFVLDGSWSCFQISPFYRSNCTDTLVFTTTDTSSQLKISAATSSSIAEGDRFKLSWNGKSSNTGDSRSCDRIFDLEILSSHSPVIRLSVVSDFSSSAQGDVIKINPTSKLKVIGRVGMSDPGEVTWSVDDPSFDLKALSISPLSLLNNASSPSPLVVSLVIPGTSLSSFLGPTQTTSFNFVLTLTCNLNNGYSSSASVHLKTNTPPSLCVFAVSPEAGVMLETLFLMSTSSCVDEDLPMSYQYGFLSSSSSSDGEDLVVLRSKMEMVYTWTTLPAGSQESNFSLLCGVRIFDNLDSFSAESFGVKVNRKNISTFELHDYVWSELNTTSNVDDMKNLISSSSRTLNEVDCSNAPLSFCESLNRKRCGIQPGTCGDCVTGYIGVFGPSNSLCISVELTRRSLSVSSTATEESESQSCESYVDCESFGLFLECNDQSKRCQPIQQSCPNACSSHGKCQYLSKYDANVTMAECGMLDLSCVARCECVEGYLGSSCSIEKNEYDAAVTLRDLLLESVSVMMSLENPDRANVITWVTTLSALATEYSGLSDDSKVLMSRLCELVLLKSLELSLSFEDVSGLEKVIDLSLSLSEEKKSEIGFDGRENSELLSSLLRLYSELSVGDMVEGQNQLKMITPLFRTSSFYLSSSSSSFDLKLSSPQTMLESLSSNSTMQSISLPSSVSYPFRFTIAETQPLAVVSSDSRRNATQLSNVFGGVLYGSLCDDDVTSCVLTVELMNYDHLIPRNTSSSISGEDQFDYFEANCTSKVVEDHLFTCPRGDELVIHCNGKFIGVGRQQCPKYTPSATCKWLSSSSQGFSCDLKSYSESSTVCDCEVGSPHKSRMLAETSSSGTSDDSTVQFSVQSTGRTVVTDFVSTWKSSSSLSIGEVRKSWVVLLTVGSIGLCFILIGGSGVYWDDRAKHETKKASAMKKVNHNLMRRVNPRSREGRFSNLPRAVGTKIEESIKCLEESLPSVYKSESLWNKFKHEVKVYHRWLGIVFHYSPDFPRYLRTLSLFSSIVIMLFIQSVTYNIADPDDGSCEACEDQSCCLSLKSSLNRNEPRCYWSSPTPDESNATLALNSTLDEQYGSCQSRPISGDMKRVFIVALLAAVLSAPLSIMVQYIVVYLLSPETESSDDSINSRRVSRGLSRIGSRKRVTTVTGNSIHESCGNSLINDLNNLMVDLSNYQSSLSGHSLEEFSGNHLSIPLSSFTLTSLSLRRCVGPL
jgi:hypothetical protein